MDGARVVVADDDENLRSLLIAALRHFGYQVTPVARGTAVLGAVATVDPELLLLDVDMPGLDGFEVCRLVRARDQALPIVFLSARDSAEDRTAAAAAGGDDYLVKPIGIDALAARLAAHITRSRRR